MTAEALEFRIAQFADGTLPAAEVAELEAILASDAEACALLESYRKLDAALKRELPVPTMNWDRLSDHLSRAVATEDERLAPAPLTYAGWWVRVSAIAALVAVAIGTAMLLPRHPGRGGGTDIAIGHSPDGLPSNAIVEVTGPMSEVAAGEPIVEVSFDATPLAKASNYGASETIVYRPSRVVLVSAPSDRQDNPSLPY